MSTRSEHRVSVDTSADARTEIERTEEAASASEARNLFDIRRVIGALFLLYGAVLVVVGAWPSKHDLSKASGVHINLWTGIGMLVVAAIFLAWSLARPLKALDEPQHETPGSGRLRRAPS